MENIYCMNCCKATHHVTVDFYGKRVHGGDKCLVCGTVHYTQEELELLEGQLAQHELSLQFGG